MSRLLIPFILLLSSALTAFAQDAPVAFVDVNAIPMVDDAVHENWTVLVEGDRITAAGPSEEVDVPTDALQIDASGQYLIPGLAEMHGHLPSVDEPRQYIEDLLFLFVSEGVTTVRGLQGSPGQLELKDEANSGSIVSPSVYLAGPAFSGGSISSPEQAASRVSEQVAEGWDFLKVLPGLTREEYDAMANRANEEGIPFIGHVPSDVGLAHALEMGQQTIDHLDGYIAYLNGADRTLGDEDMVEVMEMTLESDVWLIPTMALWETILGVPSVDEVSAYSELRYMPKETRDSWVESHTQRRSSGNFDQQRADLEAENRIRLLGALSDAGARIIMGTDAPQQFSVPGFSLRRELPLMVEAGMTPYEILVTGARSVGEYLSDKDTFGTIEPGSRADLILLNENPLEDVMHVFDRAGVMVQGRWLDAEEIDARLQEIEQRNR
jgi:imidazolonepropionase-like amidohydrolase